MKFNQLEEIDKGFAYNPYASKNIDGEWVSNGVSIDFLKDNFGHLETIEEMKNATNSEGLKLYFNYLKQQGILN